jgi:hypothetical protein
MHHEKKPDLSRALLRAIHFFNIELGWIGVLKKHDLMTYESAGGRHTLIQHYNYTTIQWRCILLMGAIFLYY